MKKIWIFNRINNFPIDEQANVSVQFVWEYEIRYNDCIHLLKKIPKNPAKGGDEI